MPEHVWEQNDPYDEFEPISSLVSDLSDSEDVNSHYYRGLAGRRRKAAVALTIIWASTIALHLLPWGTWVVVGIITLMLIHALRLFFARPRVTPELWQEHDPTLLPFVSLLVAAKNEEAVIGSLVRTLCSLDYPTDHYELWVIDDNSSDRTPLVLQKLEKEYDQLKVFRRGSDATGGKSGALNQVLRQAKGEILGVFDADAQVPADLLRRVLPLFQREQVGAVQVRKAIAQENRMPNARNFWIQGQVAEMALDTWLQQHRIAVGGIGELRGNGQFVRRSALDRCGGWNEETITDDLDLTFRLHLDQWDIECLASPPVQEEGVTRAVSLWHQRNRWAEGGYQRYLDYWQLITRNRMGFRKTFDLLMFFFIQYVMPTAAVPDLLMAIARNRLPLLGPVASLSFTLSLIWIFLGLRQFQKDPRNSETPSQRLPIWVTAFQALRGLIYMLHWFAVMASTTARMSFRPKRLKWVKTVHHGSDDLWLDVVEQPESGMTS